MPYSGADDPKLPANVKKLSDKKRRQWIHVWDSEMAKHSDESRAFAAANSVMKGGSSKKDLGYDNVYQVFGKQVSQGSAAYNPLGMADGKACANCHFFMSPDGCLVVQGDISPTGISKFWMAVQAQEQEPLAVTVVTDDDASENANGGSMSLMGKDREGSFLQTVVEKVKSLFTPGIIETPDVFGSGSMRFFKSVELGAPLRFLATVSNNFQDREAEIIPESAHKEYVEWATTSGHYPELWLWHASAKSKWGQVDWLDVADGFLVASGVVDSGKEYIAYNIAADDDGIGVSHGFYKKSADGVISKYRTFEISPLPMWAAANEWTNFNILENEVMAFTPEKKAWLLGKGMKPDEVANFETTLGSLAKELKARGVDWKDFNPDTQPQTPPVVATSHTDAQKAAVVPPAATDTTTLSSKEYQALDTRIAGIEGKATAIEASVKELTDAFTKGMASLLKSKDDSTADAYKSIVSALPKGFQASESPGNTPEADAAAKEIAERDAKQKENGWFNEIVMGGMKLT